MLYTSIAFLALVAAQANSTQTTPVETASTESSTSQATSVAPLAESAPAPAVTSAPAAGNAVVLWRNIEGGMSVAKLRSLYPQGANVTYKDDRTVLSDVAIIEGCQAKVNVMHPSGSITEIVMRGEGSIAGRCSLKIIAALSGKYGEPLEKDKVQGSLFARQGKNYVWVRDGITLQFKRYQNGALGGGGLFAASWELRYSESARNIDL